MAKCTGVRCPMQYGYKVDECNHTDCPYRTEPITNADRIRAMSDEELAKWLENNMDCLMCPIGKECFSNGKDCANGLMEWLKQPAEV